MIYLLAVWPILSILFACITPFAAAAILAARYTIDRPTALLALTSMWLINQIAGFAVLKYPLTPECFAWGLVILAATLTTYATAVLLSPQTTLQRLLTNSAALLTYQGVVTLPFLLTPNRVVLTNSLAIITTSLTINAAALIAAELLISLYLFNKVRHGQYAKR